MRVVDVKKLKDIAEVEFDEIVLNVEVTDINELRITLRENSFIEVWFSLKLEGRYSFHWERKAIDGTIYRHDNAPHKRWQRIGTFPKHFHDGSEANEDCRKATSAMTLRRLYARSLDSSRRSLLSDGCERGGHGLRIKGYRCRKR